MAVLLTSCFYSDGHICACVVVYVCESVCECVRVYVCIVWGLRACVRACVYKSVYAYVRVMLCACIWECMCVCVKMCDHVRVYTVILSFKVHYKFYLAAE